MVAPKSFRDNPPITKIDDGLYLGGSVASKTAQILQDNNIKAVVSVTNMVWAQWRQSWYKEIIPESHRLFVPCRDSMTHDMLPDLARICDFIARHRSTGSNVLVHCHMGVSRSAMVVLAYLMRTDRWPLNLVMDWVEDERRIGPNQNFEEQLKVWGRVNYKIWADSEEKVPKPEYAAFLETRAKRLRESGQTGDEPVPIHFLT
ncbi:dual specificity phosphatase [Bombardia bombarda]|uniref:protein-tyrosine-phosphatase n=1 Tax=Bombardia bombarda TaxID=252184 RepID=A0AA39X095_9PEZI|nr:dual specificity phosphatase [Bombardia bombarda]